MRHGKRSSAYALALLFGTPLALAAAALAVSGQGRSRRPEFTIVGKHSRSLIEGAAEAAARRLMGAIANHDDADVPTDPDYPLAVTVTMDGREAVCSMAPTRMNRRTKTDGAGIRTIYQQYVVQADMTSPEGVPEQLTTIYEILQTPLFQFVLFCHNDPGIDARALSTLQVLNLEENGYYHRQAAAGGIVVKDGQVYVGGKNVTCRAEMPAGTVVGSTIADVRQETDLLTTDVDVSKLNAFIDAYFGAGKPHTAKFNGVLWAGRSDSTADAPHGIRLKKGDLLPQAGASAVGGLTVVSDKPVYIQGDWNYGKANRKVPSAIIADAVEFLSNAWTNAKTLTGRLPEASDTRYYAAIVSGNVATDRAGCDGGLENLPRFHENWTGKTACFRGSFVNLFESRYAAKKRVRGGKYYEAPVLDWNYDPDFNDADKLPPFTPMAVGIQRVVWTSRG